MKRVFADAHYFIAILLERDRDHAKARVIAEALTPFETVTSEPVLVEVLAHLGRMGGHFRSVATQLVPELRNDAGTLIVPQTADLFQRGFELFAARPDKGYSLTDCMSMVICGDEGITDVLTHDRHFEQEGFVRLL